MGGVDTLQTAVHAGDWVELDAFVRAPNGTIHLGTGAAIAGTLAALRVDLGVGGVVVFSNPLICTFPVDGGFSCVSCVGAQCIPHCVPFEAQCDDAAAQCCVGDAKGPCCPIGTGGSCISGTCVQNIPIGGQCGSDADCLASGGKCDAGQCCGTLGVPCTKLSDCCDPFDPVTGKNIFGYYCNKSKSPPGSDVGVCSEATSTGGCVTDKECPPFFSCLPGPGGNHCASNAPGFCLKGGGPCLDSCECDNGICDIASGTCLGLPGAACSNSTDCSAGMPCTCHVCGLTAAADGAACTEACQCASGGCLSGVCGATQPQVVSPLSDLVGAVRTCPLSRSPFVLAHSLPAATLCDFDEDGNGLDDEVENEIAKCFVPQFRGSTGEPAQLVDEPRIAFNMHRVAAVAQDTPNDPDVANRRRLHIRMVALWTRDGGYAQHSGACPLNDHNGDNQTFDLLVDVDHNSFSWFAALRRVAADPEPPTGLPIPGLNYDQNIEIGGGGPHPVIYSSAGKHHWSFQPYDSTDDTCGLSSGTRAAIDAAIGLSLTLCVASFGTLTFTDLPGFQGSVTCSNLTDCVANGKCYTRRDVSDGQGPIIVSTRIEHAPLLFVGTLPSGVVLESMTHPPNTPLWVGPVIPDPTAAWWNACSSMRSTSPVAANGLLGVTLDKLGYSDSVFDKFTGGIGVWQSDTGSLASNLAVGGDFQVDADNDGLSNVDINVVNGAAGPIVASNDDLCPLTPPGGTDGTADADGDKIVDSYCDPDSGRWQQAYVAGAKQTSKKPMAPVLGPWLVPRGGFADADGDAAVDGEDTCPTAALGPQRELGANYWGEYRNYDVNAGDFNFSQFAGGANAYAAYQLGGMTRGDMCDPYPVMPLAFPTPSFSDVDCTQLPATLSNPSPKYTFTTGASPTPISATSVLGASDNDPQVTSSTWKPLYGLAPHDVSLLRCACTAGNTNNTETNCLDSVPSACFRGGPSVIQPAGTAGRGWIRVYSPDCALLDADGNCADRTVQFGLRTPLPQSGISWDWNAERKLFPNRFASSDFFGTGQVPNKTYSAHPYALLSLVQLSAPPPSFDKKATVLYPDPDKLDGSLAAVDNLHSQRLRTAFSPATGHISEPITIASPFSYCVSQPTIPAETCSVGGCAVKVMIATWGGTSVAGGVAAALEGGLQVAAALLPASNVLLDALVLRPTRGNYLGVALSDRTPAWVGSAPGRLAVLAPAGATDATRRAREISTNVTIAPPDLLWVERGGSSRWARLRGGLATGARIPYEVVAQGAIGAPVSEAAELLTDQLGNVAALVDVQAGSVFAFDGASRGWFRSAANVGALRSRPGAAFLVAGQYLYVAGGRSESAWPADALAVDLFGSQTVPVGAGLPSRDGARLQATLGGQSLVLAGGRDPAGKSHDDVWLLPLSGSSAGLARLVRADTVLSPQFEPKRTFILASDEASELRSVAVDTTRPALSDNRTRTDAGWTQTTARGVPYPAPICAGGAGGELCAPTNDWWATAGARACEAPQVCQGNPGVLLGETLLPDHRRAFALDGAALWVATTKGLTLWSVAPSSATAIQVGQVSLERVRAIAAAHGVAVVATRDGVRIVAPSSVGLEVGPVLHLCGQPRAVSSLGAATWAVTTTAGVVVVAAQSKVLSVVDTLSLFMEDAAGGNPSAERCQQLEDQSLEEEFDGDRTAMASVDPSRFLVFRDKRLFDIGLHGGRSLFVRRTAAAILPAERRALRVQADGSRAYLGGGDAARVVNLRSPTLVIGPTSAGSEWVRRQDAEGVSVHMTEDDRIGVAWVVR